MMKKKIVITVNGIEYVILFDGLIPKVAEDEYQRLKDDIAQNGVLVPVTVDEERGVIDGIGRLTAASELGISDVPFHMHYGLNETEKRDLALRLNALRRQWTPEQRLHLAVLLRKDQHSYRRIGSILNLSHETVRRHLQDLGDIEELPETTIGQDGIERPSKVRKKACVVIKNKKDANKAFESLSILKGKLKPFDSVIDVKTLAKKVKSNNKDIDTSNCTDVKLGNAELLLGDFRKKGDEIDDQSVDMIFTDPPYAEDALPLWEALGKFAQKVLKPGGVLLSYSGQMFIPEIHATLGKHLEYFWTFAIRHTGGNTFVRNLNIQQAYKPIVAYCKPPFTPNWETFCDMVSGGREKDAHDWQQAVEEAHYYIKHVCPKGGTICDPMMGSGTSILAGMSLGLDCKGIEIDTTAYATAKKKIESANRKPIKKAA
jgi:ParB-like chromosome segregation protein Spo0J